MLAQPAASDPTTPRYIVTAPRHPAPEGFTAVDHGILFDHTLSMTARGLLFEMLSYPPGWSTTAAERTGGGRESVAEIAAALHELEDAGLVTVQS